MASPSTTQSHFSDDVIWDSLKRAIANSSGFQRWCAEQTVTDPSTQTSTQEVTLEHLVSRYLRETLETLAY